MSTSIDARARRVVGRRRRAPWTFTKAWPASAADLTAPAGNRGQPARPGHGSLARQRRLRASTSPSSRGPPSATRRTTSSRSGPTPTSRRAPSTRAHGPHEVDALREGARSQHLVHARVHQPRGRPVLAGAGGGRAPVGGVRRVQRGPQLPLRPGPLVQTSPLHGQAVTTPVLRWNPVPNISRYKVTITEHERRAGLRADDDRDRLGHDLRPRDPQPRVHRAVGVDRPGRRRRRGADAARRRRASWPTFTTEAEPFDRHCAEPGRRDARGRVPAAAARLAAGHRRRRLPGLLLRRRRELVHPRAAPKTNQTVLAYTGVSTGRVRAAPPAR